MASSAVAAACVRRTVLASQLNTFVKVPAAARRQGAGARRALSLALFTEAKRHAEAGRTAVVNADGSTATYGDLLQRSEAVASALIRANGGKPLNAGQGAAARPAQHRFIRPLAPSQRIMHRSPLLPGVLPPPPAHSVRRRSGGVTKLCPRTRLRLVHNAHYHHHAVVLRRCAAPRVPFSSARVTHDGGRVSYCVAEVGARVAFLCAPSAAYVAAQWGVFRAGGVAVPLCTAHPESELAYVIQDSGAAHLIADEAYAGVLGGVDVPAGQVRGAATVLDAQGALKAAVDGGGDAVQLPQLSPEMGSHIVYTSGTTGRPKGALHTHRSLEHQILDLVTAWQWSSTDRILHFLPLHHVHGIVNKLACALVAGAVVEFAPGFDAAAAWRRLADGASGRAAPLTLFMAVPTVYVKMLDAFDAASKEERAAWAKGAAQLRLMVSGSAPLPVAILERWREVTGHTLLERFGSTEFGMALSNPLEPVQARRPGYVGRELPSAEIRIVSEETGEVIPPSSDGAGELRVRGPILFNGYWGKDEATEAAFDADGFYRTGDVAARDPADGFVRIMGRSSVDIIKSGGHK